MGAHDLGLVMSTSDLSQRQRPEAKKKGINGGELGGGAQQPSGRSDAAAGAAPCCRSVVVRAVAAGPKSS
jgi:hypothetical protein